MKCKLLAMFFTLLLGTFAGRAFAATYTCTLGSPTTPGTFTATYSFSADVATAFSVDVTCSKVAGPGNQSFTLTVTPNNGSNSSGAQNRAANGGDFVNYDLYTTAACGTLWTSTLLSFVNPPAGGQTRTATYVGCVKTGQSPRPAALVYSDTYNLTLTRTTVPGTATVNLAGTPKTPSVSITVPSLCTISPTPGNVAFGTYLAFQTTALTANTTFGMTCNKNLPYTLDIGATQGGVVGGDSLNYTLGLTFNVSSGGTRTLSAPTADGTLQQPYYINGSMPAGQAGTCATASCAAQTESRTLTVTY